MYSKIVNPKNGKELDINSKKGRQILKKYIKSLQTGGRYNYPLCQYNTLNFIKNYTECIDSGRPSTTEGNQIKVFIDATRLKSCIGTEIHGILANIYDHILINTDIKVENIYGAFPIKKEKEIICNYIKGLPNKHADKDILISPKKYFNVVRILRDAHANANIKDKLGLPADPDEGIPIFIDETVFKNLSPLAKQIINEKFPKDTEGDNVYRDPILYYDYSFERNEELDGSVEDGDAVIIMYDSGGKVKKWVDEMIRDSNWGAALLNPEKDIQILPLALLENYIGDDDHTTCDVKTMNKECRGSRVCMISGHHDSNYNNYESGVLTKKNAHSWVNADHGVKVNLLWSNIIRDNPNNFNVIYPENVHTWEERNRSIIDKFNPGDTVLMIYLSHGGGFDIQNTASGEHGKKGVYNSRELYQNILLPLQKCVGPEGMVCYIPVLCRTIYNNIGIVQAAFEQPKMSKLVILPNMASNSLIDLIQTASCCQSGVAGASCYPKHWDKVLKTTCRTESFSTPNENNLNLNRYLNKLTAAIINWDIILEGSGNFHRRLLLLVDEVYNSDRKKTNIENIPVADLSDMTNYVKILIEMFRYLDFNTKDILRLVFANYFIIEVNKIFNEKFEIPDGRRQFFPVQSETVDQRNLRVTNFAKTIFLRVFNLGKCNPDEDWKQSRDCGNISVWVDSAGGIATDQIPRFNIDLAIRLSENDIRTEDELRKSFTGKINELLLNDFMNKYKKPFETYPLTTFEQNSRGEISISKVDAEWLEVVGNLRPTDYGSVMTDLKELFNRVDTLVPDDVLKLLPMGLYEKILDKLHILYMK